MSTRHAYLSLLTVVGNDRPGIIAMVTGVLFRLGCNLEEISMTILDREFAMMAAVCLDKKKQQKARLAFSSYEKKWGLTFFWKDLKSKPRNQKKSAGQEKFGRYLITAIGRDRTGIVYKVSDVLAKAGLNITDLNSKVLSRGAQAIYALMLEADIPKNYPLKALQNALNRLQKTLKIEISLRPVEGLEF